MTERDDVRPVWLSERKALLHGLGPEWDAAPADAEQAAHEAAHRSDGMTFEDIADAVLKALAKPDPQQEAE